MSMQQTILHGRTGKQRILHVFCVLFKIYCGLFGLTLARILYPWHPCTVVQPLLALKYKNNSSYQKIILLRKSVIGYKLTNTEAEKLLDNSVSKPAFEFVI